MNLRQTGRISLLSVALNIMTCFSWGVILKMSCTSRLMSAWKAVKNKGETTLAVSSRRYKIKPQTLNRRTYPAPPTSCRTRPGQSAWRFSDLGSCCGSERGSARVCPPRCGGSSSLGCPRHSLWRGRRRTRRTSPWACIWRNARTLCWSGRPALVCGTWLIQISTEGADLQQKTKIKTGLSGSHFSHSWNHPFLN